EYEGELGTRRVSRRSMKIKWISAVAALALLAAGCSRTTAAAKTGGKGAQDPSARAIPVAAAPVTPKDVPVYLRGLGNVAGSNTVTLKSRVDGQLVEVSFKEGQQVKKGDLLAVIDPRPFEVQLNQAEANLFKDQAALKDAKVNLERFQALFKEGVISKQQLDTQSSQAGQFEGAVRADQAQIENVKLNLFYTRITAPVSGRVGLRLVDVGNMVHAADPSGLLVLTQLQPIAALFTLPQDNLPTVDRKSV